MIIKEMYDVKILPNHYAIVTEEGKPMVFLMTPFRKITEKDLSPIEVMPERIGGIPVKEYELRNYGFTKEKDVMPDFEKTEEGRKTAAAPAREAAISKER